MPPVVAAVVAVASAVISTVAAVFSAVSGFFAAVGAFQIGGFAIGRVLLQVGMSLAFNALFSPKRERVAARQASVLELSLGEVSRQALFGRDATGGSLGNVWNDGSTNEYETQVDILTDHESDALEGYYVSDKYYTFAGNGLQAHADFGSSLWIEFRKGALSDTAPSYITSQGVAAGEWTSEELEDGFLRGLCYVVVRYKVNETAWKGGRPQFRWLLRGLKCYDPRKDSTVAGGSGAHRWGTPSTYEWTDNAAVCRANYMWGVWNYASDPPQLMTGPGKSFDEEPPEFVIADANLCDENVSLKAGGTEKRYRVGAVVVAEEAWIDVEENFAAAMGGQLVERSGAIGVDPGAAKTPVATFTDNDLIVGKEARVQAKLARDEMCNTVVARYGDPTQLYEEASAPIRRSLEDITTDGQPYEETLDLVFVRSGTQAQRIAEIHRRKKRLQMVAAVTLGPRFMLLEDADWISWTSERRFGGDSVSFEIHGVAVDAAGFTSLALKQINSSVFAWNPATDELDPKNPIYLPPGALADAELDGVTVEATTRTDGTQQVPAIVVSWTPPTDASIRAVLIQWRKQDSLLVSTNTTSDVAAGEYVIDGGLIGLATYEVRVTPLTTPQRGEISSGWLAVTVSEASGNQTLNFTPIASANMTVFGRSLRKVAGALQALGWDDTDDGSVEWDDDAPLEWDLLGWDGHVFSAESFVGGASALGIVVDTDKALMFGLSTDPSADDFYDNITFAWRLSEDGKLTIWQAGELVWDNDGDPIDAAANDVLNVVYDGASVRYYVSGVLKFETDTSADLRLYFDTSFYSDGARLDGVSFSSAATAGSKQETRYKRSIAPPATPTDVEPADWFLAVPTGNAALWSSTSTKTLAGALVSGWSTPALLTTPNWRGTYNDATTYYREDAVTYANISYRCVVESIVGRAPSGTTQDNPFWVLISGNTGNPPVDPPDEFADTIAVPSSTEGVNLYDLAVANGYTGYGDVAIVFEVNSGVVITGRPGAPDGGRAITTGSWPVGYTFDLSLVIKSGAIVRGGGGKGGKGGDCNPGPQVGESGGIGGGAIECLTPIDIDIQSGSIVQGGGAGGAGGAGATVQTGIFRIFRIGGGGGGGGQPNGPGNLQGYGNTTSGSPGAAATTSAPGAGGAGNDGGNGGASGNAYGVSGYCVRKNGFVVNVTNSGTTAGTIG